MYVIKIQDSNQYLSTFDKEVFISTLSIEQSKKYETKKQVMVDKNKIENMNFIPKFEIEIVEV